MQPRATGHNSRDIITITRKTSAVSSAKLVDSQLDTQRDQSFRLIVITFNPIGFVLFLSGKWRGLRTASFTRRVRCGFTTKRCGVAFTRIRRASNFIITVVV